MNDPKRLREGAAFEAELLFGARGQGLSGAEKQAIWRSVSAEVALTSVASAKAADAASSGAANAGGAKAAASVTSGFGLGKSLIATGIALALGASGYAWLRPPAPAVRVSTRAPTAARAPLSVSPLATGEVRSNDVPPQNEVSSTPDATPIAAPSASGAKGESRRAAPSRTGVASAQASSLREESLLILAARQALRSGDFASTLQRLEEVRARFPRGALVQEREALTVETLGRSGARAAAERRARTFLRSYPNSPYAADVERYANP